MSWFNQVSDILKRYTGGSVPTASDSTHADFAKVAEQAPPAAMTGAITEAFRSSSTPPFEEMVSQLFGHSDDGQRAGILNHLIAAAGPAALSGGALANLQSMLGGTQGTVTPEQARQVSPDAVRQLAEHAQKTDPTIVERASAFYAQHPTLVQGLGAAAVALIMRHMSKPH
jgi:hypothetical protein